jgi:uncharacterized protein (DUF1697 family)
VTRRIALLRGINVGGRNVLAMAELRAAMRELGFDNVLTHIQSGNVVFDTTAASDEDDPTIAERITSVIAERHGLSVRVVLRTVAQLTQAAAGHPDADSGIDSKLLHVVFLDAAPSAAAVAALDPRPYEPDGWTVVGRDVYVRYPEGSARSKLTLDVFERAFGVTATARNLNTVRKVADLAARP